MTTTSVPLALLGLGHMGLALANRLLDAGYSLHVYNRTAEKARPLAERGARVAERPGDAVTRGGIAITMVSDDAALDGLTLGPDGIADALGDGVHLSMSTVGPATARLLAVEQARRGGAYVSAPVFGRPDVAAQGKLWGVMSGAAAARARVAPLLDVLTRGRTDLGDDPAAASVVKLGGNLLILAANAALTDALSLAAAYDIDPATLAALYGDTLFASPMIKNYATGVARALSSHAPNDPGFSVRLARKDVTLAAEAARAAGASLRVAETVRAGLDDATAAGLGDADVTSLPLA
ncbi:6-phosphogluconate dehydrogenase NAD-binding protein [Gemmatirosa kalamazoonensis]|uniref:6-phosphogluconate dehydrogenase NAD-binding protein n=1 Tax=Gemmatirosa kalamazoonensis TaxID=861299 RepID=W0RI42_9BACT|nr:NAD(P)-dependent oxidoreductase [Gemmatirosa kalamazoonensis]AHG89078.1 6-phosphogluconate dehydrogenase NAD-binding protein [Gemmatirosa kalamazoonensis]